MEFGYIGRHLTHEFQPIQINAVPYMMTVGGQTFAKAYGQMVWQYCGGARGLAGGGCEGRLGDVTPQPFFETALNPSYCAGYASCTAAVADKEGVGKNGSGSIAIANVWSIWSDLDNGHFKFPRSMMNTPLNCPTGTEVGCNGQLTSGVGMNTSLGYGNYNAGFVTVKMSNWHGVTLQSNFTYGKALGTGSEVQATSQFTVPDAYNLRSAYGPQVWDRKFLYNVWMVYQLPFYQAQKGFVGHLAGGWSIAPIFVTGSGIPQLVAPSDNNNQFIYGGGQTFGESDGSNFGALQNAINMCRWASVAPLDTTTPPCLLPAPWQESAQTGTGPRSSGIRQQSTAASGIRFSASTKLMGVAGEHCAACRTGTWTSASRRTSGSLSVSLWTSPPFSQMCSITTRWRIRSISLATWEIGAG